MHYDFIAIADCDVPAAADPSFAHAVVTYASETNKTASVWRAVPDRTQVQTWLRLAGHEPVPAIYGPSADEQWAPPKA